MIIKKHLPKFFEKTRREMMLPFLSCKEFTLIDYKNEQLVFQFGGRLNEYIAEGFYKGKELHGQFWFQKYEDGFTIGIRYCENDFDYDKFYDKYRFDEDNRVFFSYDEFLEVLDEFIKNDIISLTQIIYSGILDEDDEE